MKPKKSKLSLIALILGIAAVAIQASAAMGAAGNAGNDAAKAGTAIGLAIVAPAFFSTLVAAILNLIGYLMAHRTLTLISAIIYTVALIVMPLWGFVAIPSMILQYIAFAKMKKQGKELE